MLALLRKLLHRSTAADLGEWRKCTRVLPVRLINGDISKPDGQIWRRWQHGLWQYRQDEETLDEHIERQAW